MLGYSPPARAQTTSAGRIVRSPLHGRSRHRSIFLSLATPRQRGNPTIPQSKPIVRPTSHCPKGADRGSWRATAEASVRCGRCRGPMRQRASQADTGELRGAPNGLSSALQVGSMLRIEEVSAVLL
eukprot:10773160-Lingulodinium_polyedra.AAC.1